jgi:hypothetical protein
MKVLETNINFENAHEDNPIVHPFRDMTFKEIKTHMEEIEAKYPEFCNFRYEEKWKSHGYGAMTGWYDLEADYKSELLEALD